MNDLLGKAQPKPSIKEKVLRSYTKWIANLPRFKIPTRTECDCKLIDLTVLEIKKDIEKIIDKIWLIHEFYSKMKIIGEPNCGCDFDDLQKICNELENLVIKDG